MSIPRAATSVATSRSTVPPRARHDAVALGLRHAAVQRRHAVAAPGQPVGQLVDVEARAAEDERERRRLEVEHAAERRHLVRARHDVRHLPDLGHRPGLRGVARDQDALRVAQVPLGDGRDARRERRGEERRLPGLGRGLQDQLEVLGEAHVEHLVGLVEGDHAHVGEVERLAPQVVEGPPGRRHDDMRAAAQRRHLSMELLSAVDRHHRGAELPAVAVEGL
jgi:hypothetical protein